MKASIFVAAAIIFFSANAQAQKVVHTKTVVKTCTHHNKKCCSNITPRERMAISRQQHDVRLAKKVAMSDGVITRGERKIIRREQIQANNTVYRAQNNNRVR